MSRSFRALAVSLALVAVALLPGCGGEPTGLPPIPSAGAVLSGRVLARGAPLPGATVRLEAIRDVPIGAVPRGIYFIRLNAGAKVATQRLAVD